MFFFHYLYRNLNKKKVLKGAKPVGAEATTIVSARVVVGIGNIFSFSIHFVVIKRLI